MLRRVLISLVGTHATGLSRTLQRRTGRMRDELKESLRRRLLSYYLYERLHSYDIYILLDVLVCSIAVYFYELCGILTSP